MSDPMQTQPDHPHVDPERTRPKNAFDGDDDYSGQSYSVEREEAQGRQDSGGFTGTEHPSGAQDPAYRTPSDEETGGGH